jgi:hypothetical protein
MAGSAMVRDEKYRAEDMVRARFPVGISLTFLLLLGCARPEESSFGVQAARRGEDCKAIATGSAMDAYGHGVGPAEEIYDTVKRDCLAWRRREAERLDAARQGQRENPLREQ